MQSQKSSTRLKTTKSVILYLAIVAFSISLIYATHRLFLSSYPFQGLDFRYLWIAGRVWLEGKNPYDLSIFSSEYEKYFGFQQTGALFYPPSMSPICMLLSVLPFKLSEFCWRVLNYLSVFGIVLISFLHIKNCHVKPHKLPYWKDIRVWLALSYSLVMQSTLIVFTLGQTSIIATLGMQLLLWASLKNYWIFAIIGGYILSLKPTLGIIPLTALLVARNYRIVLGSVSLSLLMSFFAFFSSGLSENIRGFLTNTLSKYSMLEANQSSNLTGLTQLLDYFLSLEVSSKVFIVLAIFWGIGCGLIIRSHAASQIQKQNSVSENNETNPVGYRFVQATILMNLGTILLMPLHIYDFVFIIPAMIYSLYLRRRHMIWLLPGWIVICRAGNWAKLTGIDNLDAASYATGCLLASLFTIILVTVSIWGLLDSKDIFNNL